MEERVPTPAIPESLRGRLKAAHQELESATLLETPSTSTPPLRIANVIARSSDEWQRLRTSPELIQVFTQGLAQAKSPAAIQAELEKIPQRLLSTGVYSDVAMHLQPSIAVAATSRTRDVDLVIELKESHHRLETGIQRASDGQFQTALEGSALNWFGSAERFSVSLASAKGDLNLGHLADALSSTPSAGQLVRDKTGALAKDFLTPTLKAEFKKPTLGNFMTPLTVRFRRETERPDISSSFTTRVRELEVGLSDPSSKHAIGYVCAWRDLIPVPHPTDPFKTANSPQVVAQAQASLKSSVTYQYTRNRLRGSTLPVGGYRTLIRAELAGLGGDVSFAKLEGSHLSSWTLGRFAPDTGYREPLHKSAYLSNVATAAVSDAAGGSGGDAGELRPHPGASMWASWTRQRGKQAPAALETPGWTIGQQLAGWLSPGMTLLCDTEAGILVPLGASSSIRDPVLGDLGARIVDRFFLPGTRIRGFDCVGPRAQPVEGGIPCGDGLGGEYKALASARLLLPPPFPSVRLANAGLRTQLWATAGCIAQASAVTDFASFWQSRTLSAGVGLCWPLFKDGLGLEVNFPLLSQGQPSDVTASFRLQLSA